MLSFVVDQNRNRAKIDEHSSQFYGFFHRSSSVILEIDDQSLDVVHLKFYNFLGHVVGTTLGAESIKIRIEIRNVDVPHFGFFACNETINGIGGSLHHLFLE